MCVLAFQLPYEEDVLVSCDWQLVSEAIDDDGDGEEGMDGSLVSWKLTLESSHALTDSFVGFFLNKQSDDKNRSTISFFLSIECHYPHTMEEEERVNEIPTVVKNISVSVVMSQYPISSPLQYLKLLSSFAVVARHDRDGEHARGNLGGGSRGVLAGGGGEGRGCWRRRRSEGKRDGGFC